MFITKLERGAKNAVWTIEKLEKHFSMSDQQVYRRINVARRLLEPHIQRGDKNAIELTEGGFRILEQVVELEKQGRTLANAVDEVERSLHPAESSSAIEMLGDRLPSGNGKLSETQFRALVEEIGYLKGLLEAKGEQLAEVKAELQRVREENEALKRSVALVEYKAQARRGWRWFLRSA